MVYDIDLSDLQSAMTPKGYEALSIKTRYLISYGGAGSGKSYSTAQKVLFRILTENGHRFLIARKTARSLKRSVFQLFRDIISKWGLSDLFIINLSDLSITCKANQNQLIMSGLDDVEKLKSITGITSIWIEEASEITQEDFIQLDLRLRGHTEHYKQIIMTFNPTSSKSWLKARFFDNIDKDATIIHSTYLDNPFLDERYKQVLHDLIGQNKNLHDIYTKGIWGDRTGLIYPEYELIEELPEDYEFKTYGIDFGFNHPQALVEARVTKDTIYVKELFYKSQTLVTDLISFMKRDGIKTDSIIYADSANPDKIQTIVNAGYRRCKPAKKDVLAGIDHIKSKKLYVTADSINLIKELESYSWKLDKNGEAMEVPAKLFDDALDALRYAVFTGEKIKISIAQAGRRKHDSFKEYGSAGGFSGYDSGNMRGF
ncbi:PBSX family phage terminase large subunit [Sulfurovum mangrovi]|uniref:PBSX family phage terminase large subunit n=1 Tax=Sulfurovum mangrovi TaxID=2893889 RepID=UPI001E3084CD|nr:PBSX family phage terminase large subunit [Sulfurovum mangrovi]UFH60471.1 PBSX family phage terminase large subunit [Sulfurovum mangrovi]